MRGDHAESELDCLYQLPLADFTEARNQLAKQLRSEGQPDAAARVKTLTKPSAPAWAVNQLYWSERPLWEALLSAGERLRAEQQAALRGRPGADLAGAMRARREAVAVALKASVAILARSGAATNLGVERRLRRTLEALAAEGCGDAAPGRLASELEPTGFDALAVLAQAAPAAPSPELPAAPGSSPPTPEPEPAALHQAQIARAREAVARAESELARSRRLADQADSAVGVAAVRAAAAAAEVEESERRLARARERAAHTQSVAREAEREAEAARRAVADAERALAEARGELAVAEAGR